MKSKPRGQSASGVTHEQIAARAYQIYLASGRMPGHDRDNWLQAEYELRQVPLRKLATMPVPPPTRTPRSDRSLIALVRSAML